MSEPRGAGWSLTLSACVFPSRGNGVRSVLHGVLPAQSTSLVVRRRARWPRLPMRIRGRQSQKGTRARRSHALLFMLPPIVHPLLCVR